MQDKTTEVYALIIVGSALALLLVGFIVTILFLYQKRQHRQEQELAIMKGIYEQELLKSQLEIQEMTFKNIAQEIHDNIGQTLSLVKLTLSTLPISKQDPVHALLKDPKEMLNKAIYDLTDISRSLHSDRIAQIGLIEALRMELETLNKTNLYTTVCNIHGGIGNLDPQKEIILFRIAQEIINNIVKHSKATSIAVDLYNGVGFDVSKMQQRGVVVGGVGLKNMVNRAQVINARFTIDSNPGEGTSITVDLKY
jgi:two-component system, NarL family, sensor kinase